AARDRAGGLRGPRPAARDRPPGRHPDPRPHGPRAAQGGAPGAPRRLGAPRPTAVRVVFAGSPEPAAVVLRRLIAAGHEIPLAVSQPDRPRGRGGRARPTPLAAEAERLGIEVIRPRTINDPEVVERLLATGAGALVVVAFGQIIREALLSAWPSVDAHFSLLPAYPGAAPVARARLGALPAAGVAMLATDA